MFIPLPPPIGYNRGMNRSHAFTLLSLIASTLIAGCSDRPEPATLTTSDPSATPPSAITPHVMRYPTDPASWQPMPLEEAMKLIDNRDAWADYPPIHIPPHPAEKYLKDLIICLDPGHGMSDGETDPTYKRGPTGVREDDMNLRVALLLRRLLTDAGATVIMTRDVDALVTHAERKKIAIDANADLFISIHHNAASSPSANYSSVWYHRTVDESEVALDVSRSIAHRLGAHMRTDVGRTSPILSDQLMYNNGFGQLRGLPMPAVLLECSFFSNPAEEQRLRDAGYNLRTAYAIYEGLCEYAYNGRPRVASIQINPPTTNPSSTPNASSTPNTPSPTPNASSPTPQTPSPTPQSPRLVAILDDGLPPWWGRDRSRIPASSVSVSIDGQRIPHTFNGITRTLEADLPALAPDQTHYNIDIRFTNKLRNSVINPNHQLTPSPTPQP